MKEADIIVSLRDNFTLNLKFRQRDKVEIQRNLDSWMAEYTESYMFDKRFKDNRWDGKIHFYNRKEGTLPRGLLNDLRGFCDTLDYTIEADEFVEVDNFKGLSGKEIQSFILEMINNMGLPDHIKKRPYQLKYFAQFIKRNVLLAESPTASGKSLIIYFCIRYVLSLLEKGKQILLIVPTTQLVEQMYGDFKDYGFNSEKHCARIYAERKEESIKKLDTSKRIIISTWQSLQRLKPSAFENIGMVIGDEIHEFKAVQAKGIVESCKNAIFRLGTTGTLHKQDKASRNTVVGLFDIPTSFVTILQLIKEGYISDFRINVLNILYPDSVCEMAKKFGYQDEVDFIKSRSEKKSLIKKLSQKLVDRGENTLILFKGLEYGKQLVELLGAYNPHYVDGNVKVKDRKEVVVDFEASGGKIAICSFKTFQRGINIKNLHNVIFAESTKTEIGILQAIGRALRIHFSKKYANIWDIVDNMKYKKHENHFLKHFTHRRQIYVGNGLTQKIKYKKIKINSK